MKFRKVVLIFFVVIVAAVIPGCVDLVDAEYQYQDNLIFIDAYALTDSGTSTVAINRSNWDGKSYSIRSIPNATVQLENVQTGSRVDFLQDDSGVYVCPPDFAAAEGEVWKLYIELEEGRKYESTPETTIKAIPIDAIKSEYSPEVTYDETEEKFVPGHRITVDWQDPAGEDNYYLWKYKIYQPLFVCKTCEKGIFRNGECLTINRNFGPSYYYYNYLCDPVCWSISFEEETVIFEDRLTDGAMINNHEIATLPFYRRPDILIEVQQLSLNKSAYNYFKIVSDQASASGGLNAPPAAPLLGNLSNPNDPSEIVLGQFTTAGVSSTYLFMDRSNIPENPFRPDDPIILEGCPSCPATFPCKEGLTRTSIKPKGWQ